MVKGGNNQHLMQQQPNPKRKEYPCLTKLIRNGKGPEGGFSLQILKRISNKPIYIEGSIGDKISNLDGCATRRYLSSFVEESDIYFFRLYSFDMQVQIALFKKIILVKETHQEGLARRIQRLQNRLHAFCRCLYWYGSRNDVPE